MDRSRSSSFVNGQRPSLPLQQHQQQQQPSPLDFNPELTNGFDTHSYLTVDGFDSNPSFNRFDPLGAFVSPTDHQRMLQSQQDQQTQNIMMQAYEIQQSQSQSQSQSQLHTPQNGARRSVSATRKDHPHAPLSLNTDRRVSPRPSQLHLQTSTNEFDQFANGLDSQLLSANWDPTIDTSKNVQHGSIDPSQLFSNGSHFGSTSPSAPQSNDISPSSASNPYLSATMSRNPSQNLNLDPATAALGHPGFTENWSDLRNRASFQHHRRGNSDALSDVSSLAPSPYLETVNFEAGFENASPLLQANDDTEDFSQGLDVGNISLGGTNGLNGAPTYPMSMTQGANFQMSNFDLDQNAYALGLDLNGLDSAFPGLDTEPQPAEMGNADVMTPPEIQVDLAEPTRPIEQGRHKSGALSPPDRGRVRSISDPYSRQFPIANKPLSANGADPRRRSLSPYDTKLTPGQAKSDSLKLSTPDQRRRSTSMISDRGHVLDLADPTRSTIGASQRVRKHPAIYTCDLCPKSFTRAYNLRSHHRTHTDERPFVCTDCGKAFARQHDRKRHEALHTGEKKFVCKGELQNGGQWGCGRRFARADALGRHFRSEAGGTCIKPLLEEEAMEKNAAAFNNQMLVAQSQSQNLPSFGFPAALLAQFPDLQGFQWSNSAFDADPSFLDEDEGYLSAYSNSGAEPGVGGVGAGMGGNLGVGDVAGSLGPNWMPGAGVGVNANGTRWPVMNGGV